MLCKCCGKWFYTKNWRIKYCSIECNNIYDYKHKWYLKNKVDFLNNVKLYNTIHKIKLKNYKKEWYDLNKERILKKRKKYYEENSIEIKQNVSDYFKTVGGRKLQKRSRIKRKLYFEFNLLNENFCGSSSHHIDFKNVIYIPKNIHKEINHSVLQKRNMEIINAIAFFFLIQQNIKKLSEMFS